MTEQQPSAEYTPRIILDVVTDPQAIERLQQLDEAIHTRPTTVLAAASPEGAAYASDEEPLNALVAYATSKESPLEFDDETESAIAVSATMKQLTAQRRDNRENETRSQELAAEVRRQRLILFVQRAMEHDRTIQRETGETQAEVVNLLPPTMPNPREHGDTIKQAHA